MTTETLQVLAAPGAVAATLWWLHVRLDRVERTLENVAAALNAAPPPRRKRVNAIIVLPPLLAALAMGCASVRQTAFEETIEPDGSYVTRRIESRVSAIGDAKSLADKLTVSQDRQAIGAEGASASATASNAPATIEALTRLLEAAK